MRKYWIWLDRRLFRGAGNIVRNPDNADRFRKDNNNSQDVNLVKKRRSDGVALFISMRGLRKSCCWGSCRRWRATSGRPSAAP